MSQAQTSVRFMPSGSVQQAQAISMPQLGGMSQSQISQSLSGGQQQGAVPIPQSIQGQPLTSATIQKLLDENAQFIQAICDYQSKGRAADASSLQKLLHTNLVYLATLADNCVASQTGPQPGGQQTAGGQAQGSAQMALSGSQMHVAGGSQMPVSVGLGSQMQVAGGAQMQMGGAQSQMMSSAQQQQQAAIMNQQQHQLNAQQAVSGAGNASQAYVGDGVQSQQPTAVYYAAQPQGGAGGMYIPAQAVTVYRSADPSGNMQQQVVYIAQQPNQSQPY